MGSPEIMEQLGLVFREVFDMDGITIFEAMTADDLAGWDSLNHINLVLSVERAFGIKFTTREILASKNVGDFANVIERKLSAKQVAGGAPPA